MILRFFKHHVVVFFEASVLKEVGILRYLNNSSAVLVPEFENKAVVAYT